MPAEAHAVGMRETRIGTFSCRLKELKWFNVYETTLQYQEFNPTVSFYVSQWEALSLDHNSYQS